MILSTAGNRIELPVLYRDADLLVVNKPAGLLVHRGWGNDAVTALSIARAIAGTWVYPAHRLDRGTSGALAFALSPETARRLGEQLRAGEVDKTYVALVRGLAPEAALVDHALARSPGAERLPARTRVSRLASFPVRDELVGGWRHYAWVEARPETGRLHQVRRHLKHLGHPIIGDVRHGKAAHNRLFRRRFGFRRMALHALGLGLRHPTSGAALELKAPLARELEALLAVLADLDESEETSPGDPAEPVTHRA